MVLDSEVDWNPHSDAEGKEDRDRDRCHCPQTELNFLVYTSVVWATCSSFHPPLISAACIGSIGLGCHVSKLGDRTETVFVRSPCCVAALLPMESAGPYLH